MQMQYAKLFELAMRVVETWLLSRDDEELPSGDPVPSAQQQSQESKSNAVAVAAQEDSTLIVPPKEQFLLPLSVKIIFSIADAGPLAFASIMGFFLNAFLLETAGVSPGDTALILLMAKISDAIADPFVGFASDRTRTRWGRRKIWVAFSFVPMCVLYVAVWLVPNTTQGAKFAYYLILHIAFSFAYSTVSLPINSLAPELTTNYDERTSVMVYKIVVLSAMNIIATFVQSIIIGSFYYTPGSVTVVNSTLSAACNVSAVAPVLGNSTLPTPVVNTQLGYLVGAVVFAAFAVPPIILFLFCVPEKKLGRRKPPVRRDGSVREQKLSPLQWAKSMVTNRSFMCLIFIYLLSQLAIQFVQNNLLLFIKYVLHRESWFSFLLLALLGTVCLSLPFWERMTRRFGKKAVYAVGSLMAILVFVSVIFIEWYPTQLAKDVIIWFTAVFGGICIGALFLIPSAMFPDVIEQDELATGMRREGMFYAFLILFQKVALAVAVALSNVFLQSAGYISPESVGCSDPIQPQSVTFALSMMVGAAPAGMIALSLIVLFFYPITKEVHLTTLSQLEENRKRRALITTDGEVSFSREREKSPKDKRIDFD